MATSLASLGLTQSSTSQGSGIDVTAVVDQIIYSEQAPERLWQQQQAWLAAQATALNSLKSGMQALQTQMFALTDLTGVLAGQVVTSSAPTLVTAAAQAGAANGVHSLVVQNLATVSSYYTDLVASSSTTLDPGTISLKVGASGGGDIVISDANNNNTLDKLAAYINAHDYGVQASVVNDMNGARLALMSKTSGSAGDLTVTANTSKLVFTKSADGVDASFTLDGVPLKSGTNTVSCAIPGVTLNLLAQAPQTTVTLTIAQDTAGATQAINDFVSAYNTVINAINAQFKVDANNNAGLLASNSAMRTLQSSLLADVAFSVKGNNGMVNLASMGVDMADDGTLSVDSTKVNDALSNHFADVQNFFQSVAKDGFGTNFNNDLNTLIGPGSGVLTLNISENSSNQRALTRQINDFEDRLAVRRQQLITQYSAIDTALREYPVLMQQISSQLANLPTSQ